MKYIVYRKKGLKIAYCWFDLIGNDSIKCDVISYHDLKEPIIEVKRNVITRKAKTLVNELDSTVDELFSKVHSDTRNKIRRAEKEGITTKFYSSEDILRQPEILDELIEKYNDFSISKNLGDKCYKSKLMEYCKVNMLFLTAAVYQDRNIVFHVYVGNGEITRGLYTVSLFRDESQSYNKNLYGNANKLLHWKDMCKFRELGYTVYDWAGYSKAKALQSINKFKESFGGVIKDRYHYMIPNSLLGSLVILAIRFTISVKTLKSKLPIFKAYQEEKK